MAGGVIERVDALQAYPTLSSAARILGVAPSTLSRRTDLQIEARGERDKVLRPAEVMRLAVVYRKRSLNEVAADLVAHVREHAPDATDAVDEELETFIDQLARPASELDQLLELAERNLPENVVAEIRRVIDAGSDQPSVPLVGGTPE
jgi:hypothetical protein